VACLAGHGVVADEIEALGISVTCLGARRPTDIQVLPRLYRLIKTCEIDTVLSFLIHANAASAAVAPFLPQVRFLQSIQTTQPEPRWHWQLQRLVHHFAERLIVPSQSAADAAVEWSHIPRSKIMVIPNAIDPADYADVHPPEGLDSSRPFPIGFIGRLDPVKRVPDLIEAVALLGGLVHLHVFGDGPERPLIQRRIDELRIGQSVILHGTIDRPQDALGRMGVLVLPSAAEGFGLVLVEAMAAGVAVIGTNVAGIRDVVRADQTGLLVPAGDPGTLAGAIRRLIESSGLRRRLVESARADVALRFTWQQVIPLYRALLCPTA
jgi:glycosyltransferase involved in cell wall biosynthesis